MPLKTNVNLLEETVEKLSKIVFDLSKNHDFEADYYDNADVKRIFKLSDSTLFRYRKHNKIPYTKWGGRIWYPKSFFKESFMNKVKNKHLL
ncbi:hypothetical protein [Flavobacterium sp.]|jgi:hypothetical protein|uniref:hypothetical protein n=1 Tax=Flavobacterium sp. TaxID=239 RepID=UPI0025BE0FC5|nr:hypothetical protein [Flavobacterium sp.]